MTGLDPPRNLCYHLNSKMIQAVTAYSTENQDRCSAIRPPWGNVTVLQKSGFCV